MKKRLAVIGTGAFIGLVALLLSAFGNPANMGFCIACFIRDIAGSTHLHSAGAVAYMRPEIAGIVLGACVMALIGREFRPSGGSSPVTRFIIAAFVMIGALMFLGCPLRMMLRIGGGDLNALVGLAGFAAGLLAGVLWLRSGFSLKRAHPQARSEGLVFPILLAVLLALSLLFPTLFASTEAGGGPGALRAAVWLSLIAGLAVGALCQRVRFCTAAAGRDAMLFKDFTMLWGFLALIVVTIAGNLILGKFSLSFADQPVAHTDGLWNFLGMALVGWGSVLLGGCPLRQLILAGEGNSDSGVAVMGFLAGAAVSHNFSLASSAAGPTQQGM
ncbi:MAG: YedE family putative selenium transporter, partial [Clostridia bacterium]|nr:YedE family putative selenium transporter [Clostridia bacterium]